MTTKKCSVCGETRPLGMFYRNKKARDGLTANCVPCRKEYDARNAERRAAYFRQWVDKNREHFNEIRRRRYSEIPPEQRRQKQRESRAKLAAATAARDASRRRARPEVYAFYTACRQAAQAQRTPPWLSAEQRKAIADFYEAARVASKFMGVTYQVDHIVPLRGRWVSGLHVPWNLQLLTAAENATKHNRFSE